MGYLTKEIFEKSTLFSILCIIGIVVGIPYGIYGLTLDGGQSLAGTLVLVSVMFLIIILVIDRVIASKIKPLKLSLIELFLTIIILTFYQYNERKIFINLMNYNENYFVVIYNDRNLKENKIISKFPFDNEIVVENNFVIIPRKIKAVLNLKVISPKKWNSLEMKPDSINGYSIEFYNSEKKSFEQKEIENIVKIIIDKEEK
jgi:hypothetical protein